MTMKSFLKTKFTASLFFAAVLATAAFSVKANAGILIEPYLGYHMGKTTCSGCTTLNDKGVSYGGRLGFESLGFMVGLDGMSGSWTDDDSPSNDLTPTKVGAFVGYDFPILLRVYGVYNFSSDVKYSQGGSSNTDKGTGYKLGVGYHLIPMVSLNFEYMSDTYTKDSNGSLGTNITYTGYGLTVSIPFDL